MLIIEEKKSQIGKKKILATIRNKVRYIMKQDNDKWIRETKLSILEVNADDELCHYFSIFLCTWLNQLNCITKPSSSVFERRHTPASVTCHSQLNANDDSNETLLTQHVNKDYVFDRVSVLPKRTLDSCARSREVHSRLVEHADLGLTPERVGW